MPISHTESLADFHEFVGRQLERGECARMSAEEAVVRWREHQATLAAIREGLADIDAGRTRPVEDLIGELRARLPAP